MEIKSNYAFYPSETYLVVRISGDCDAWNLGKFEEELIAHLNEPIPHMIVNCEFLTAFSKDWARVLLRVQSFLKQYQKEVRLILVTDRILQALKKEGLDSAFKYAPTLRDALLGLKLVSKKMLDTNFINPFLNAALHVLKVQASVTAEAGKVYLKKDEDQFFGDVSGVIGIVSETFNGSVVISFPEAVFLKVMTGMLGEECSELTKEIADGVGEITNMIFGQAKVVLNEKGYGIKMALPSVVTGKNHSLSAFTKGPVVIIPFKSNAGDFHIVICLSA